VLCQKKKFHWIKANGGVKLARLSTLSSSGQIIFMHPVKCATKETTKSLTKSKQLNWLKEKNKEQEFVIQTAKSVKEVSIL
jgi:hypothetical protein